MKTFRQFQDESKQYLSGASNFEELWKNFTLKNDFYQPISKYTEEELLDPKAINVAKQDV